jgi:hypothetical protein
MQYLVNMHFSLDFCDACCSVQDFSIASVGSLAVMRFVLSTIGFLSAEHKAATLSLLINSGLLALLQTLLRLLGTYLLSLRIICDTMR